MENPEEMMGIQRKIMENHGKICFKSLQPSLRDIHQLKEEYYEFARIKK